MRSLLLVLLLLTWTSISMAMRVSLFLISDELRYVENENREYSVQSFRNFSGEDLARFKINKFSGALTFENYQFGAETFELSSGSGTELVGFYETRRELHTYHLFKMAELNEWLRLYSGFGIGAYEIELTNQFNGAISETSSGQILLGSGIVSAQVIYKYFHAATDLKLLMAKDYRPQPTPILSFKVGVSF